jgi:DNA-directed RNA polymerase I subunit RPA49
VVNLIAAKTPGMTAPNDIAFTPYRKTTQIKSTGERRRQVLLQSSQHGRLDYIAQEEAAGGPHGNLRHYVAVFDPEKGEVTVTECHRVTLRASLRPSEKEEEEMKNQQRESYANMRVALGQEFGTKKAKKVIADQTVNAINQRGKGETAPPVDAVQQAMLDALNIKTENMPTKEEQQALIDQAKPRPNPNLAAASPADVYPIPFLVSEEDLELLKVNDWKAAAKKQENVNLNMRYVARRLQKVATVKDDTNLKLLKYVNIMLMWFAALPKTRDGRKLPQRDKLKELVDAPAAIFESFRRQFTEGLYVYHLTPLTILRLILTFHKPNDQMVHGQIHFIPVRHRVAH